LGSREAAKPQGAVPATSAARFLLNRIEVGAVVGIAFGAGDCADSLRLCGFA
jgi:hypothetical protein